MDTGIMDTGIIFRKDDILQMREIAIATSDFIYKEVEKLNMNAAEKLAAHILIAEMLMKATRNSIESAGLEYSLEFLK